MKKLLSKAEMMMRAVVQHYNPDRYWKYREAVISAKGAALIKLFYIKRCDAFNNASMGTHIGYGAKFASPPNLPHGLYGIIVSHNAVIGCDCTIFHQVTIGEGKGGAPVIGDHVLIGAGAKLIGGIHIGSNVRIGAGAIVCCDVPDGATVVMDKPRILIKDA